jgi:hypothetical protein
MTAPAVVDAGKCEACGGIKVIGIVPDGSTVLPIAECRSCGHRSDKDIRAALRFKELRKRHVST